MLKDYSSIFYQYLLNNGFNPNDYHKILELVQNVPNSMSAYMQKENTYLLSKYVDYNSLDKFELNGACGYLDNENGIDIPTPTVLSGKYFPNKQPVVPKSVYGKVPTMDEFDVVVAFQDWHSTLYQINQLLATLHYRIPNNYFGFIADKTDENLKLKLGIYKSLLESINAHSPYKHELIQDYIKNSEKEIYLIRTKKEN